MPPVQLPANLRRQHAVVVAGRLGEQGLDAAALDDALRFGLGLLGRPAGHRHAGVPRELAQRLHEAEASMLDEVVEAVAASRAAAREVVPGRRREDDARRGAVVVSRRASLEHRARGLEVEVEVAADEPDEVRPRLHVVNEAPERAVVEPSSGQPFIRRAVQALAEVTRSGRRVGRIVGGDGRCAWCPRAGKAWVREGGDTRRARAVNTGETNDSVSSPEPRKG